MKLSELTRERQLDIKLQIPDGDSVTEEMITVKFKSPSAATLDAANFRAESEGGYPVVELLADLLTDTGIDDEEGNRIKPTHEELVRIPFVILRQISSAITDSTLPKKAS